MIALMVITSITTAMISVESIAHAHGMSWQYANDILNYADTGGRPAWQSRKRTGARKGKMPKHIEMAEDVARMRDEELKPFAQIAAEKGVGYETVCRAYDYARPEAVREAAEKGKSPQRGRYSHLGPEKFEEIRKLLREGKKDAEIADAVGCGTRSCWRQFPTLETLTMAEPADEESLQASQKRVQPFLDCVSYLLAKRWLRDQRQQEEKPPQEGPELQNEQPEP
jgi:hypothetical protein